MLILKDKITNELGFGGAGNGGKSWLGCSWIISDCLAYPGIAPLIGRKELTNLEKTTMITFYEFCEMYGLKEGKHFTYDGKNHITNWLNGSQIFWIDLSYKPTDPLYTRLGSLNLTEAFIDESNEVNLQAINIVKTRLGRRKNAQYNLPPKLLETFNPEKGHVTTRYWKPWKNNTLPENRKFVRSLYSDNPYATEDWKKQILSTDKVTIERLLYGNFDYSDDPNTMISFDAITDLFSNTLVKTGKEEKYLSVDTARYGGDRIVFGIWKGLSLDKIITKTKQGIDVTKDDVRDFAKKLQIPYSHIIVDDTGSASGGVSDYLRGVKSWVSSRSPFDNQLTGQPDNFKTLKDQCAYKLADLVNDHEISIHCDDTEIVESLTEELGILKMKDPDNDKKRRIITKDEMKELLGHSPDILDMMIMRMWFEFRPQKRIKSFKQQEAEPISDFQNLARTMSQMPIADQPVVNLGGRQFPYQQPRGEGISDFMN